jgi:hypothetical protein
MPGPNDAIKTLLGTNATASIDDQVGASPVLVSIASNGSFLLQNISRLSSLIQGWR